MSHHSVSEILTIFALVLPCMTLIGVWASVDMARLIKAARKGEI